MNPKSNLLAGLGAGFAATLVLSALMILKQRMGLTPDLNPAEVLARMSGTGSPAIGWLLHFAIGTIVWGLLFAWVSPMLPGSYWLRGVLFATGAWLVMMLVVMPMAGAGLFGLNLGTMAPVATLVLHWVFGVVLGAVYGAMTIRPDVVALSR